MAVFSGDDYQRLDYSLMQNGAVNLYSWAAILADDIEDLKKTFSLIS